MAKEKVITHGYDPESQSWYPIYDKSAHSALKTHVENSAIHVNAPTEAEAAGEYYYRADGTWHVITGGEGKTYTAGSGIDATQLANGVIAVSGDILQKVDDAITTADLTDYALKNEIPSAISEMTDDIGLVTTANIGEYIPDDVATTADVAAGVDTVTAWVENQHYLTAVDLSDYETTAHANATYQPKGEYLTTADLTDYYTKEETSGASELTAEFAKYQTQLDANQLAALAKVESLYNSRVAQGQGVTVTPVTGEDGVVTFTVAASITGELVDTNIVGDDKLTTAYLDGNKVWHVDGINHDYTTTADVLASANAVTAWVDNQQYLKANDVTGFVTSEDLTNSGYLTKDDADGYYQPIGDYLTTADESKFQPTGDYATTADLLKYQLSGDYATTADLLKYQLSGDYITSAGVESTTAQYAYTTDGWEEIEYPEVPDITGVNGVTAEYDEELNQYKVGLEENLLSYGRFDVDYVSFTGTYEVSDYRQQELYSDNIALNDDKSKIVLQKGFYHIDAQVNVKVDKTLLTDEYYEAKFETTISPKRSVTQQIDGSYEHTETISLSFDLRTNEETELSFVLSGLPVGAVVAVAGINVHEIVAINGNLISQTGDYTNGDAISIDGNVISVDYGRGLKVDENGKLEIRLGEGLKFVQDAVETDQIAIDINDVTEETVEQVQELATDLDEKVTTTYDYAGITTYSDMSQYGATTGNGVLIRYLFSVPIKNAIYVRGMNAEDSGKVTVVGVYASQSYTQKPIMFGIYEYNPEYKHEDGSLGRTVALCDTGPVTLKSGFNEFEMVHFNKYDETTPDLKSSCIYYAALYVSKNAGTGIDLATCPGYDVTFNANPQLTCDQSNVNFDLSTDEDKDKHLDDMGWGQAAYHELPQCPRVFMQFRNKKIVE